MSSISNDELERMRAQIAQLLPGTCQILSVSTSPDGQGGNIETWGTVVANVPCRIDPLGARDLVKVAGKIDVFRTSVLTVDYDTEISVDNRIEYDNNYYGITAIDSPRSWALAKRCYIEIE